MHRRPNIEVGPMMRSIYNLVQKAYFSDFVLSNEERRFSDPTMGFTYSDGGGVGIARIRLNMDGTFSPSKDMFSGSFGNDHGALVSLGTQMSQWPVNPDASFVRSVLLDLKTRLSRESDMCRAYEGALESSHDLDQYLGVKIGGVPGGTEVRHRWYRGSTLCGDEETTLSREWDFTFCFPAKRSSARKSAIHGFLFILFRWRAYARTRKEEFIIRFPSEITRRGTSREPTAPAHSHLR